MAELADLAEEEWAAEGWAEAGLAEAGLAAAGWVEAGWAAAGLEAEAWVDLAEVGRVEAAQGAGGSAEAAAG